MATWLYKDGAGGKFEADRVNGALQAGWSVTDDHAVEEVAEAPTFEEADTNGTGKLSVDEIRAAAQEAGIDNWDTARIKTLKGKLGYDIKG